MKLTRTNAREVDFLGEDKAGIVHHVEFQVRKDGIMHSRMLAYMAMIAEKLMKQRKRNFEERRGIVRTAPLFPEIRQVVVSIGKPPMRMRSQIKTGNLTYGFSLVNARDLDGQALIDSPGIGDAVLAVLRKDGSKPDLIRKILKRIVEGDPTRKDENGARLLALSGLSDANEVVETEMANMNFQLDLNKVETFREFNKQGQAKLVADQIVEKFKIAPAEAEDIASRVAAASQADIKALSIRVLTASNLAELFDGMPEPAKAPAPSH